jgi:hypothetical protein
LYKFKNQEIIKIIKGLSKIPFIYSKDKDILDKYFKEIIKYLKNNILNYFNIKKFRHSNSYIENYNKHAKTALRPFI